MDYYNIHTHDIITTNADDDVPLQNIYSILNVYPLEFEYAKDSIGSNAFSCGVHPWYSEDAQPQIEFLKEIVAEPKIIAIGEAGYDKLKGPDLITQKNIFEQQVILSEELNKPLIIHCVKAWDELLSSHRRLQPKQTWIIHGYRGKPQLTKQLLKHDFYFSVGERFNHESLKLIPTDRLFCETDVHEVTIESIYAEAAETLEIEIEAFCLQIKLNVEKVFFNKYGH